LWPKLIHEIRLQGHFRLNKICQTATGLAKAFSRYYNRVRVLREPLPHLLPAVFARLTFLSVIKRTFEQLFHLLDIVPISKM
jgi:arginyl-tRNA synthetase